MVRTHLVLSLFFITVFLSTTSEGQDTTSVKDAITLKTGEQYIGTLVESTHPDTILLFTEKGLMRFYRPMILTTTKESVLDAVVLKNGESFVGILLERTHPDTVLLLTAEGSTMHFHRPTITTITKEYVLKGYVSPSRKVRPRFTISPGYGITLNRDYSNTVGISLGYQFESSFFLGASVHQYFGTKKSASPLLFYREQGMFGPSGETIPLTEESRATVVNILLGTELSQSAVEIKPYLGFGLSVLKSVISFNDNYDNSQREDLFLYVPEQGTKRRLSIPLGLHVGYPLVESLIASIELRQQIIVWQKAELTEKTYYSFIENSDDVLTIVFRLSMEL